MTKKPYVLGGLFLLLGYFWCWLTKYERSVSAELMTFHRSEQLARLGGLLSRRVQSGRNGRAM